MNILVTGANGQLGNEMRVLAGEILRLKPQDDESRHSERMRRISTECKFVFTDITAPEGVETTILDITDLEAVRRAVEEHCIDCIVNCAAYTNVDAAETNRQIAELLNARAPENLAIAMKETGGLLIHISTDYVFGKEPYNTPCREDQQGTPTGVYGETKLQGEQNIISTGCKHVIIRTAWLYSEFGRNFVKTMLSLTATRPQLKVVFDQVGTPTYALDLARAILAVLEDYEALRPTPQGDENRHSEGSEESHSSYGHGGIYHYSNEGVCSWYDFTKAIARMSGHTDCDIRPCHSDEFPSPVKRPAFSVLDKTKIKSVFGIEIPYWTDSLKACLANMGEQK